MKTDQLQAKRLAVNKMRQGGAVSGAARLWTDRSCAHDAAPGDGLNKNSPCDITQLFIQNCKQEAETGDVPQERPK